jgi:hypothetical protein
VPDRQQSSRRNLVARVYDAQPAGKLTNHGQLSRPGRTLHIAGLLGPLQCQLDGNEASLPARQEPNELPERLGRFLKAGAKGAACRNVFAQVML